MGGTKLYIDNYNVKSPFYKLSDKTIITLSDVHFHQNVDTKLLLLFLKYIENTIPDFIVILGDLIDTPLFIENNYTKKYFLYYLKCLSEICKIVIIPGNHDIGSFTLNNFKNRLKNTENYNKVIINFLESLNTYQNVYFLNNEQVNLDGINFMGFNPSLITYLNDDDYTKEILLNDYIDANFKFSDDEFNVFLSHYNGLLNKSDVYNKLSDIHKSDLLLSGHYHNGYMPRSLNFYFKNNNNGLYFTPKEKFFNKNITRGIHEFGRGYQIISKGFRKFGTDLSILNFLDSISSHDIDNILLSKSDNLDYTRTLEKKV